MQQSNLLYSCILSIPYPQSPLPSPPLNPPTSPFPSVISAPFSKIPAISHRRQSRLTLIYLINWCMLQQNQRTILYIENVPVKIRLSLKIHLICPTRIFKTYLARTYDLSVWKLILIFSSKYIHVLIIQICGAEWGCADDSIRRIWYSNCFQSNPTNGQPSFIYKSTRSKWVYNRSVCSIASKAINSRILNVY